MCSLVSTWIKFIHIISFMLFYTWHKFSYFSSTNGVYAKFVESFVTKAFKKDLNTVTNLPMLANP
jgi:hypothetical protein